MGKCNPNGHGYGNMPGEHPTEHSPNENQRNGEENGSQNGSQNGNQNGNQSGNHPLTRSERLQDIPRQVQLQDPPRSRRHRPRETPEEASTRRNRNRFAAAAIMDICENDLDPIITEPLSDGSDTAQPGRPPRPPPRSAASGYPRTSNRGHRAGTSQMAQSSGSGQERNENQPPTQPPGQPPIQPPTRPPQPPARPPPPGEHRHNFRRRLRNLENDLAAAGELVGELEEIQRQERQLDNIEREQNRQRNRILGGRIENGHPEPHPEPRQIPVIPMNPVRHPFQELTYQMATLTAELGNLRDVMQGLSNTIYDNTNILEQIIRNNEEVLNEYEFNR